jgi:1,3-beta-glucan synthase
MSGHPQGGHYDDGYGNQGYYDNNGGYADQHVDQHHGHQQGADGYYDES